MRNSRRDLDSGGRRSAADTPPGRVHRMCRVQGDGGREREESAPISHGKISSGHPQEE